jgi:hypothetical protein
LEKFNTPTLKTMSPFASVILPTLNRSSTLPYALASVQNQTEQSIEIIVVLDGATEACRDIAQTAAMSDQRVIVLDLTKNPGQRGFNMDYAVRSARSERIFYIDDDDLWLPSHVAHLGPLLAKADIIDSRVCSLARNGGLHLGPCAGSNQRMRHLLAHEFREKFIYDTHIAHRKDSYGVLSSWIAGGPTKWAVWNFLAGFAVNSSCRWESCETVTALSIHAAARRDCTSDAREIEIKHWSKCLNKLDRALSEATILFHLFRLLVVDPPQHESFYDYMAERGAYSLDLLGRREEALFSLFTRSPPDEDVAVALAGQLAEPVESGYMFESVALAYFQAYGQHLHEHILLRSVCENKVNAAGNLAAYSAALIRRDRQAACEMAKQAIEVGPDPVGSLAHWLEHITH